MDIVRLAAGELLDGTLYVWPDRVDGYDASFLRPDRDDVYREPRVKAKALESDRHHARTLAFADSTEIRSASKFELLDKGLRDLVRRLRVLDPAAERLRMAVPALSNAAARTEYWHLLRDTARKTRKPFQAAFLTEPDAVLQYFRLVRREVDAPRGVFQAYLVIDAGAGTTNVAVVFKPKTRAATTAELGRNAGPLEPVAADAPMYAGYAVDQDLIAALLAEARRQISPKDLSDEVIRRRLAECIEAAKIAVSIGGTPRAIELPGVNGRSVEVMLTPRHLSEAARKLWQTVGSELRKVLSRTYEQLSASARYRGELEERGILAVEDMPLLFRYVILAGGTSRLPGFREALLEQLPGFRGELLGVGEDYPYAVAAGLAAHALEARRIVDPTDDVGSPPPAEGRLEQGPSTQPTASQGVGVEEPTLPPPAENIGVARIIGDVELVYRREGQEKTWGRPLFQADIFPGAYEVESAGSTWNMPTVDRKKARPPALLFGLAYSQNQAFEREGWSPENMFVQADGVDAYWVKLDANLVPDKVRVVTRFDPDLNAMIAEVMDLEGRKIVRLRGFVEDPPPRRPKAPVRTPAARPAAAIDVGAPGARALDEGPAATGGDHPHAPEWDLCVDLGTSKIVVVRASPGYRLTVASLPPITAHSADAARGGETVPRGGVEPAQSAAVAPSAQPDPEPRPAPETGPGPVAPITASVTHAAPENPPGPRPPKELAEGTSDGHPADVEPAPPIDVPPAPASAPETPVASIASPGNVARAAVHADAWRDRCTHLEPRPLSGGVQDERAWFDGVTEWVEASGLQVSRDALLHMHLSAKVSPLVALYGPPGVGKSSLARAYAQALGATVDGGEFVRVAVEAAWTDSTCLHAVADGHPTPFLELAARAEARPDELFVAVLEEWNLAQVDYYMSQVLATLSDGHPLCIGAGLRVPLPTVPGRHRFLIFGTMNVDEAGTSLTDKVLDRCGIVELTPTAPGDQIAAALTQSAPPVRLGAADWARMCELPQRLNVPDEMKALWKLLSEGGDFRHVYGHRVLRDACAYLYHAERIDPEWCALRAFDLQLSNRVLPRLRGDETIDPLLKRLETFAEERGYESSRARLGRMRAQLGAIRAVSFWTA